jgi:CRP-like cAMP-binding protein
MADTRSAWTHEPTARTDSGRVRRQRLTEKMALLTKAPLFDGLPQTHLRKIAKVTGVWNGSEGKELVKEGVAGSVFFVILDGSAKVIRRGRTINHLGPGDFLGEMSILTDAPRSASVMAETAMTCLTLSAADLRAVLLQEPAIAVRMLNTLALRLADLDRRLTS